MTEPTETRPAPPATPELDKLLKVTELSQPLGEFLEWYRGTNGSLVLRGELIDDEGKIQPDRMLVDFRSIEAILAEYFEIDLVKASRERTAVLAYIREQQTPTLFGS